MSLRTKFTLVTVLITIALVTVLGSTLVAADNSNSPSNVSIDTAEDVNQITALVTRAYRGYINSHNAIAYATLFASDVLWAPPNSPDQTSREGVQNAVQALFDRFDFDVEPQVDEIEIMDDFAYVIGTIDGVLTPHDGTDSTTIQFRVFWMFRKQGDGWKIVRQIWNNKPVESEVHTAFAATSLLTGKDYMK